MQHCWGCRTARSAVFFELISSLGQMTHIRVGRKIAAAFLLLGSVISSPAFSASWGADAGDAQLRSDIELLAAAGVIDSITQAWPLAWGSIKAKLQDSA